MLPNYKDICFFLNTLRYLKFSQIYWRFVYLFRKKILKREFKQDSYSLSPQPLIFSSTDFCICPSTLLDRKFFSLNISEVFLNHIDWNFMNNGKLWCYNLNYFDFLNSLPREDGIKLILDFVDNISSIEAGMESYPISVRGVNWIKFLSRFKIEEKKINDSLYFQYKVLANNFEKHLLGNHLLENAFSLLIASLYFNDKFFFQQAQYFLREQLEEQIHSDGGHFELSPMYHQLILFKLLDCINALKNNPKFDFGLCGFLETKALLMLQWLDAITFKNGNIPLFNDCANNIAPKSRDLFFYAEKLGLSWTRNDSDFIALSKSGYFKYSGKAFELVIDMGNIGPDYIPGHAHCDIFSFELYYDQKPLIVDTGTATYEKSFAREVLRRTSSHNTVMVNNSEQSEVWGVFRVAKRAYVEDVTYDIKSISGKHTGFREKFGITHERRFEIDNSIKIFDSLTKECNAEAFFHFAPGVKLEIFDSSVLVNQNLRLCFSSQQIELIDFFYQPEFNKFVNSKKVVVRFSKHLNTEILFEDH